MANKISQVNKKQPIKIAFFLPRAEHLSLMLRVFVVFLFKINRGNTYITRFLPYNLTILLEGFLCQLKN